MRRAASRSVAICASWNCTAWNSAIAFPNCFRSFTYFVAASSAPAGHAEHLRADADSTLVQGLDGDLVALAHRAEHVGVRDDTALEDQLGGAGGADAELVLLLAHVEAREAALDQERRDALVALGEVGVGEDDEDAGLGAVGDPELAARCSDQPPATLSARHSSAKASLPLAGSESAKAPSRSAFMRGK